MKIRILAEGSTKWQRFVKHWGLSLLVDEDILFDTFGQPGYVVRQLSRFSMSPQRIRTIVVSHDDWDHIAGLPGILKIAGDRAVYICPNFRSEVKAMVRSCGGTVREAAGPLEIRENICVSGELQGGSRRGVALPEQYMAIKTSQGVVILTGCAHPGIVEIVRHAKTHFGPDVRLLAGGFHLKDNRDEVNAAIVKALKELGVRQVMPLHCTGKAAVEILRQVYGKDCIAAGEGQAIEV